MFSSVRSQNLNLKHFIDPRVEVVGIAVASAKREIQVIIKKTEQSREMNTIISSVIKTTFFYCLLSVIMR